MIKERDIKYETDNHWILQLPNNKGFEVYKTGLTHSTRCSQIGFSGNKGLTRAINEAKRRENELMKETITISLDNRGNTWQAKFSSMPETLSTPFTVRMPKSEVIERIQRLNPNSIVK